ncbi:hypothetical protein [Stenotrophomonas sp.]|uniref:hypothetical protein n=1 Tax=Stenotrophomonas sp. TaxID=69392 RepID=UPI0025FBA521|nr:hypothetical protein [Stenotrophomonas sp.]MBW8374970.1 ankyrin repeat domain-containing protein [Stenotrophomonas sp.]
MFGWFAKKSAKTREFPSSYYDQSGTIDANGHLMTLLIPKFKSWIAQFPGEEKQRVAACERLIAAGSLEELKVALEEGAFVDCYTGYHKFPTPLTNAACSGELDQIKLLLNYGADINDMSGTDFGFGSPVNTAYFHKQFGAVALLLKSGANFEDAEFFHLKSNNELHNLLDLYLISGPKDEDRLSLEFLIEFFLDNGACLVARPEDSYDDYNSLKAAVEGLRRVPPPRFEDFLHRGHVATRQ